MSVYINNNGTWTQVIQPYIKSNDTWYPIKEQYINDNGTWKSLYYESDTKVFATANTWQSVTIPIGVFNVSITAMGGGGGSGGWHDSGYGTYACPGGPGGAAIVNLSVTPGDTISVYVGGGGGPGGHWSVGYQGQSTTVQKNGSNVVICNVGGLAGTQSCGSPSSSTIYQGSGNVYSGSSGYQTGGHEWGYNVWQFIANGWVGSYNAAGIPAISYPTALANVIGSDEANRCGRAQYRGYCVINYLQ